MAKILEFKKKKQPVSPSNQKLRSISKLTQAIATEINASKDKKEANETILLTLGYILGLSKNDEYLKQAMSLITKKFLE